MRLLNVHNRAFEEFYDSYIPPYAILSHRWGGNEVTFQQLESSNGVWGPGFEKIEGCCYQAKRRNRKYVWIDTCCIDKKSSAELSEAINSMYRWYAEAEECYAYLSDIRCDKDVDGKPDASSLTRFENSNWFTRGWTLQELLAPRDVIFFDHRWITIGAKANLAKEISKATGIPEEYVHESDLEQASEKPSVAMKMSWASRRQTSRKEDMAYCLLGIFDVNMPLLYGEGQKAFIRLQLEIIRKSDDESVFAWWFGLTPPFFQGGMLALDPSWFANSGDIRINKNPPENRRPYSMTNRGLELNVPYLRVHDVWSDKSNVDGIQLVLNCWISGANQSRPVVIFLVKFGHTWRRVRHDSLKMRDPLIRGESEETITVYVKQDGL